jgi:high affinity Mn2+ porin
MSPNVPGRNALASCLARRGREGVALVCGALLVAAGPHARADEASQEASPPEWYAVHGQFTYVEQETNSFYAPYRGPYSLSPSAGRETTDATLYLGARLWPGAEGWLNPEIDQGFGLDDTQGVAGFPSGEAYKVGKNQPYLRLQRAFIRQTLNLEGASEQVEAAPNQLGGTYSTNRWVFTLGKFAVTDVFDTNQYAHDPRADFLNWTAVDTGTFDYAADAWGYTVGTAAEWYHGAWAVRAGAFDLSRVPNSEHLDPGAHEFQLLLEAERRYQWNSQPGKVLVTLFHSRGRMGLLQDAIDLAAATGAPVDIAAVRKYRSRDGVSFSLEQQICADVGAFVRGGGAGGNVEAYEFTDVDRTLAIGLSLHGSRWGRSADTLGFATIFNAISATRERYLDAGGLGILVGDGRLPHPGGERMLETYYAISIRSWAFVGFDYQYVANPAYNRDRGPASIFAVRIHLQF